MAHSQRWIVLGLFLDLVNLPAAAGQEKSVKEYAVALKHPDLRVRLAGLSGLAGAGAEAAPHVEAIAKLLKDVAPVIRRAAAQVLGGLGADAEKAAPALAAALKDSDPAVKHLAAKALVDLGPKALPALEGVLKETDPSARMLAVSVIEAIGLEDPAALKALALAVKDVNTKVRLAALGVLAKAGAGGMASKEIAAALGPALLDKSPEVRGAAAAALMEFDKAAAVPTLLKGLKDPTPGVRQTAAQALGTMGDELEKEGILALRGALTDEDAKVRQYAAAGLAKAGVKARELGEGKKLLAALFKLLTDKEANVRQMAVYALGHVGIDDKEEIKMLAEGLKDSAAPVRAFTLQALAQYSHEELPADWRQFVLGFVAEGVKDKDKRVVFTAANILIAEKGLAVPGLVKLVEAGLPPVRILASQVLAEMGEEAKEAVPALQKMSREGSAENRKAALLALTKIQP